MFQQVWRAPPAHLHLLLIFRQATDVLLFLPMALLENSPLVLVQCNVLAWNTREAGLPTINFMMRNMYLDVFACPQVGTATGLAHLWCQFPQITVCIGVPVRLPVPLALLSHS